MTYYVFISRGWHDRWIAKQMARLISDVNATPFIDIFDTKKCDRIEARVHDGLERAAELVALITPWSVDRNWVWAEIAAMWAFRKRYTGVLYGLTMEETKIAAAWRCWRRRILSRSMNSMTIYGS